MHIFRDPESIRGAPDAVPQLASFINRRLQELSEYDGYELDQLVNIIVVECCDSLDAVNVALGFEVQERQAEVIEAHIGWYELTYVLSDDGFGLVVYVPDSPDIAPQLLRLCREQAVRSLR